MALLHATQLYVGNVTSVNPTKTLAYTVPAGMRIILRSVDMRNLLGTGGQTGYVYLAGVLAFSRVLTTGGSAGSDVEVRPWIVLTPGQQIQLACTNAAGIAFLVSGSIYTI